MTMVEASLFGTVGLILVAISYCLWRRQPSSEGVLIGFTWIIGFLCIVFAALLSLRTALA
jgi:hypothetical protein